MLVTGETGTGKELVARAIHRASSRQAAPLITVHCGALPDNLLESELFGYEKGAFTGATSAKPGRVALAESGTLFLDEIGDISQIVQIKLLRLLQEREYDVLGGHLRRKADVRFVAATHRDLRREVADRTFREDLFYRLNVVPVHVPRAARASRRHSSSRGTLLPAGLCRARSKREFVGGSHRRPASASVPWQRA